MNSQKYNRVIFLDIDGVLNSHERIEHCETPDGLLGVDTLLCERLNRVVDAYPDLVFVLSSTWRVRRWDWCREYLAERGFRGTIVDRTRKITDGNRKFEILDWCEVNGMPNKAVSVDDDHDAETEVFPFVNTKIQTGITEADVDLLIHYLT